MADVPRVKKSGGRMMSDKKAIVEVEQKDYFIELDRRDQQQIVMHALGEVVDELFYEVHGRKCLSWEGINTVAFFMGDIEVDPWVEWERIEMFEDRVYWSATVRARNTKYNLASLGTAEAPELMDVYDRDERNQKIPDPERKGEFKVHLEPDDKCRRKALGKAQRNAKKAVMPAAVMNKWLQYFIGMKLFQKGTRQQKPEMPFAPKTVDAEYHVLDLKKKTKAPTKQAKSTKKKTTKKKPKKPEDPDKVQEIKEQARRDLEKRQAEKEAREKPPEEEPAEEKPIDIEPIEPPEEPEPEAPSAEPSEEEPPQEEESPKGPPVSVEDVTARFTEILPGWSELVKVTEYPDYFRVGRRKILEKEIEDHIDFIVSEMGGEFNNDKNAWQIPRMMAK